MRLIALIGPLALLVLGLGACANGGTSSVALPLAEDHPTLLLFYTDN